MYTRMSAGSRGAQGLQPHIKLIQSPWIFSIPLLLKLHNPKLVQLAKYNYNEVKAAKAL